MTADEVKDVVRRWMNGDSSVVDEVIAKGKVAQMAVLSHVGRVGTRSTSCERLGAALRKKAGM